MSQSDTDKYQNEIKLPSKRATHDEEDDEESKRIQWNKLQVFEQITYSRKLLILSRVSIMLALI